MTPTTQTFTSTAKARENAALIESVRAKLAAQAALPPPLSPAERLAADVSSRARSLSGAARSRIKVPAIKTGAKETVMAQHPVTQSSSAGQASTTRSRLGLIALAFVSAGAGALLVASFLIV